MILVLGLLPFLVVLISALVIGNAGRNSKEKVTLFFFSPQDTDKASSNIILGLRVSFWVSLFLSAWIVLK